MRRRAPLFAVFSLTLCAALAAQQPTFRTGVALVTVDVTVLDKDGKPVPGLSAEDFEIKLNGKPQPVRALAFVQAAVAAAPSTASTPAASVSLTTDSPKPAAPAAAIVAKEVEVRRTVGNQDDSVPAAPVAPPAPTHPAPAAPAAPAPPAHQNEPRTFVILIDDLSFGAQNGKKLFAAAQRFVDTVPPSDPVGFTTTSGSSTVNPTMNRTAVKAGLAKVVGEFIDPRTIRAGGDISKGQRESPIGMDEAIDIDRGDDSLLMRVIVRECFGGDLNNPAVVGRIPQQVIADNQCAGDVASEARRTAAMARQTKGRQLAAAIGVINAMRTAAGIRHLVFVTDGIPVQRDVIELQPLTRAAAAAGVQISVIMEDPDGVDVGLQAGARSTKQADSGMSARVREDNRLMLNGAETFTDVLGGSFYKVVGEADTSFARVLAASSAVYRLGVELPSGTQPGKELSLGVNIKRPGLTVRANKMAVNSPDVDATDSSPKPAVAGAIVDKPANELTGPVAATIDDVLKAALNQTETLRGVPIRLGAMMRRSAASPGQIEVSVNAWLSSSARTPVTALLGVVDDTGALRVSRRVVDKTSDAVPFLLPLAQGNYSIRFAAADADKALGTVELPLAVKLHTLGAFTASDVLTFTADEKTQKAALFSTDEVPAAGSLHAAIELYPQGAMPGDVPTIRWTVAREGETKPVFEEDTDAQAGPSMFRADAELPFATFSPGTYVIRATLLAADGPAGSVGATIRKK